MANTSYAQHEELGGRADILLYTANYAARPVIIDDTGVAADAKGRKIVPAGTFLGGFFERPNEAAIKIGVSSVKASYKTSFSGGDNNVCFVSKLLGAEGNAISIAYVDPGINNAELSIVTAGKAITVHLETNGAGAIVSKAKDIADAVNADALANDLVYAKVIGSTGNGVVTALAQTNLASGKDGANGTPDGVLRHAVDVTHGEATGTAVIAGFIDLDRLPDVPTDAIKASLPTIKFMRRD